MGSLGPFEIFAILLVILLIFGAKRIPEIARGLGKGIREFKDATNDIKKELTVEAPPPQRQVQPPAHTPTPQSASAAQTAYAPPSQPAGPAAPAPAPPPPTDGQAG